MTLLAQQEHRVFCLSWGSLWTSQPWCWPPPPWQVWNRSCLMMSDLVWDFSSRIRDISDLSLVVVGSEKIASDEFLAVPWRFWQGIWACCAWGTDFGRRKNDWNDLKLAHHDERWGRSLDLHPVLGPCHLFLPFRAPLAHSLGPLPNFCHHHHVRVSWLQAQGAAASSHQTNWDRLRQIITLQQS